MTTDTYAPSAVGERIRELCRQFRLPTLAAETVSRFSDAGHADALPTLMEVLEQEAEDRRIRRVDRLRRASKLPAGKTWDTFEHERAQVKLRQQLVRLAEGDFVERDVNVLAFGLPGTGKTHAMCCCLAITSTLTAERKCPHDGECDIDAARTGKTSGTQQLTGWIYDDGAGSDTDGSEHTPHQAHTGGLQREGSSRTSSR